MNRRYLTASLVFLTALAAGRPTMAGAAASVRLAGHPPDVASLAAFGLTNGITHSRNLSMRAVLAIRNRDQLDQLLGDLQNPSSPDYYHWLAPGEFTTRFGPTADQIAQVSSWLSSQGFTVTSASADDRMVRFTGSAALTASAFDVKFAAAADGKHFANLDSPAVPSNLAGMIQSIQGLNNLYGTYTVPLPDSKVAGLKKLAFGPPDMYVFYDENPLLNDNINGTGADCIALPEFSDFDDGSVAAFNDYFNLPSLTDGTSLNRIDVDGAPDPIDPQNPTSDQFEALLDVQYSHAAAPQTPINVYIAGSDDDQNPALGFLDTLNQAVNDNACGSISLSIGVCPSDDSVTNTAQGYYEKAFTQGQTVFAAAGDAGAAGLTVKVTHGVANCVAGKQRGVNETAASPLVTSVGGTESKPKFEKESPYVVAGPAAETVWHEKFGSGGGGASSVFPKPDFQSGITPNDNARDIPDISLLSAVVTPGYFIGFQGTVKCCGGGTSFASPYWAGIAALMEQMNGGGNGGRLGAINTELYSLASSNAVANGIRDVTKGANGFAGAKGFKAIKGYDQASGWGTPDISVFAHAYTGK